MDEAENIFGVEGGFFGGLDDEGDGFLIVAAERDFDEMAWEKFFGRVRRLLGGGVWCRLLPIGVL